MKVDIEVRGFTLTEALRGYVQRRLHNTLGWYADRIQGVALLLEEIKGSPGGLNYKSRIRLQAADLPALVIEERSAHLYLAVDRAAGRAGRRLARANHRGRDRILSDGAYGLIPDFSIAPRFREWSACRGVK